MKFQGLSQMKVKSNRKFGMQFNLQTVIASFFAVSTSAAIAASDPAIDNLRKLSSSWDADLSVALEGGKRMVDIGDPLRYHLNAGRSGVCYLIHVDTEGASSLMRPSDCSNAASSGSYFPSKGNLEAAAPMGKETVFAVMLKEPSTMAEALLENSPGYVSIDSSSLSQLTKALQSASTNGSLAIAETSYSVGDGQLAMADSELQFTTRGIIRKVVADTQSKDDLETVAKEISFDVQSINFEFGSDELAAAGILQLNEFGAAMQSPELDNLKLRVAGHTDDLGEAAYNLDLSQRRAAAVARYLKDEFHITSDRLEIMGMGEDAPLVTDTSLEARAKNRRVEMVFLSQ